MGLIETIDYYLTILFWVIFIILAVVSGVLYYLLKVKKVTAKTERINHDSFQRRNAIEFVKFEDIVTEDEDSLKSPGMVCLGNNTFVAGIDVVGYNYISASSAEKQRTMINAISFFNVVEKPIQLRQTVRAVDLTSNIQQYEQIAHDIKLELIELSEEYDMTIQAAQNFVDSPEEFAVYEERLKKLQRTLQSKQHSLEEADALIRYMNAMAGGKNQDAQKINQIMFSYTYNPNDYTEELTKEQIYIKALAELSTMGRSLGEAIARCGISYKRLSGADLVMLMRRHSAPLSSDDVRIDELFNTSFNSLFISSNSLIELEKEREEEEIFAMQLEQLMQHQDDLLRQQEQEAIATVEYLYNNINEQMEIMRAEEVVV